jgi:hypothetical protein
MADMSEGGVLDHRDLALQSLDDYGSQLKYRLRGLELEEARWMPTPESNHILWILWHMGRMEDMWGWYLDGGKKSAWIEGGWADRFGIDHERNGYGDSIEQVRDFPDVSVDEVTAYWQASRDLLIPAVWGVTAEMLGHSYPAIWEVDRRHPPTLLWALGRIPVENGQHTGQIAYIRGLYAAKFG